MLPSNLTMTGSEFHTAGAATEKVRVPTFVFTRGKKDPQELLLDIDVDILLG